MDIELTQLPRELPKKPSNIVFNTSDELECQPNYRKWERIWKGKKDKDGNLRYPSFDPDIYYHSIGWFGTPEPESCKEPITTAANLYCKFTDNRPGKDTRTKNKKCSDLYKKYTGGLKKRYSRRSRRLKKA